jgi:hypothetical protein
MNAEIVKLFFTPKLEESIQEFEAWQRALEKEDISSMSEEDFLDWLEGYFGRKA